MIEKLTLHLKILSTFIDDFAFWVDAERYALYEESLGLYQEIAKPNMSFTREHMARCIRQVNQLEMALEKLLSDAITSLDDQEIKSSLEELKKLLKEAERNINETIQSANNILEKIKARLAGFAQGFLEKLSIRHLQKNGFHRNLPANHFQFTRIKQLQHELYACRQTLFSTQSLLGQTKIKPLAVEQWLTLSAYQEAVVVAHILKMELLQEALSKQITINEIYLAKIWEKVQSLKQRFPQKLSEMIRLYRAVLIYQVWQKTLENITRHFTGNNASLNSFSVIQELIKQLTYQKKQFLKQQFKQLPAHVVIRRLFDSLAENTQSEETYFKTLKGQKDNLKKAISAQQERLLAQSTFSQHCFAQFGLAMTQQPDYQLGYFMAQYISAQMDARPDIPVLGERLPPQIQARLNQLTGSTILLLAWYFAQRTGYSYYFFTAISRTLLAQIDKLVQAGQYVDHWLQATLFHFVSSPDWLRFDEQGILEKDEFFQWLLGLGMQLCLDPSAGIKAVLGYSFATGSGYLTDQLCQYVMAPWSPRPETELMVQIFVRMQIYSMAYQQGYLLGQTWQNYRQEVSSQNDALRLFGLNKEELTTETVKQRYRQLSLQWHPDKCTNVDKKYCETKFSELTQAHDALMKKLQ